MSVTDTSDSLVIATHTRSVSNYHLLHIISELRTKVSCNIQTFFVCNVYLVSTPEIIHCRFGRTWLNLYEKG